jgi:seryl-tRNA synthetase
MHDIRWIRDNAGAFDRALGKRGSVPLSASLIACDGERRAITTELQQAQTRRNEASKLIGKAKAQGEDADGLIREVGDLKDKMQSLETREGEIGEKLNEVLSDIPNLPAADVPVGEDEAANIELRLVGDPFRRALRGSVGPGCAAGAGAWRLYARSSYPGIWLYRDSAACAGSVRGPVWHRAATQICRRSISYG